MIVEIIHKLAEFDGDDERKPYYPRPSIAGPQRCARQMVYWGLGFPARPLSGRNLFVFDDGNWHEELTKDWIRKSAWSIHSEQMEVKSPGVIAPGHIDGILLDPLGLETLFEHKAINHFSFQRYAGLKEFPEDYFVQVALYLWGLAKVSSIKSAILLIKNKNTAAYLEYLMTYYGEVDTLYIQSVADTEGNVNSIREEREDICTKAEEKFMAVDGFISRACLPPREYDLDDWQCEYCQWGKECWSGLEQEQASLPDDIVLLPDEMADTIAYRQEVAMHRLTMEKEEDALSAKIKREMASCGSKKARAGDYLLQTKLVKTKYLDKEDIPAPIIKKATKTRSAIKVTIKKLKGDPNVQKKSDKDSTALDGTQAAPAGSDQAGNKGGKRTRKRIPTGS